MSFAKPYCTFSRLTCVALIAAGLMPLPARAANLEVGTDKTYKDVSSAIAAAQDGDKILVSPGEYFDCAMVKLNNLTIEGLGDNGAAILTDKTCAGKGLLVISGNDVTVRNLTLTRARVPDGNGAGIRAEGVNLTVERVKFINNQNGILANPSPESTIIIRESEFSRNGACNPACAHGMYINLVKLLRVERSKFFDQRTAHHIKSRAFRTEVIGNSITDGETGTASYLIEAPNGGTVIIRDNILQKGPKSENHKAAIMIGAEGVTIPTREITVSNNTFSNTGSYPTFLVVNRTAQEAILTGNKISGSAKPLDGDGEVK